MQGKIYKPQSSDIADLWESTYAPKKAEVRLKK